MRQEHTCVLVDCVEEPLQTPQPGNPEHQRSPLHLNQGALQNIQHANISIWLCII